MLGLGDIGPEAALPVMEGKAMLFKEFGGVDALPICLGDEGRRRDRARPSRRSRPVFGGINLEDISAPRCFEIEERLRDELDIPVFHDDQHGTAVVVLAALLNALKVVGKRLEDAPGRRHRRGRRRRRDARKMLIAAGVRDVVGCDRAGHRLPRPPRPEPARRPTLAEQTNPRGLQRRAADDALAGADVFIGLSRPGRRRRRRRSARWPTSAIVFAMANPTPEVHARGDRRTPSRVIGTGRSDYPNQINNVLAFPGIFRGALDVPRDARSPRR